MAGSLISGLSILRKYSDATTNVPASNLRKLDDVNRVVTLHVLKTE
jgi:hypothetical protein